MFPKMLESSSYWIATLEPFRQGTTLLPHITAPRAAARAAARIAVPAPATGAVSADVLALGALALVISRYNGGEPLLIASPLDASPSRVTFLTHACDESQTAGAFLENLRSERDEAGRHEPCSLEQAAS